MGKPIQIFCPAISIPEINNGPISCLVFLTIEWISPILSEIHKHGAATKLKSPVKKQKKITFFLGQTDESNQDSTEDIPITGNSDNTSDAPVE
jgi:hypothetical protein